MAHDTAPPRFRYFPLLLGGLLLLGQLAVVYHQTEHSLAEPGQICLICQAADHMQHGLATAALPVATATPVEKTVVPHVTPSPRFIRAPTARSPPSILLF